MSRSWRAAMAGVLLLLALFVDATHGQTPAEQEAKPDPRATEALEPAVDTSAPSGQARASAADRADAPGSAPAETTPSRASPSPRGDSRRAMDRVELEATQITGNRELPKVLYIVPWKRSDLGDLAGKPVNSLLDEVLAPVDREVFRRQTRYYEALRPDGMPDGGAPPGNGPEK